MVSDYDVLVNRPGGEALRFLLGLLSFLDAVSVGFEHLFLNEAHNCIGVADTKKYSDILLDVLDVSHRSLNVRCL